MYHPNNIYYWYQLEYHPKALLGLKYVRKEINVQTLYKDINRIQLLLAVLYTAHRIVNLGYEHWRSDKNLLW